MIRKNPKIIFVMAAALTLLAASGCTLGRPRVRVGELRTKSEIVKLVNANSTSVEINMAAGDLYVSGGASELLEAVFTYNVPELEPQVEYQSDRLIVRTPDLSAGIFSLRDLADLRYEWDLHLGDNAPMKMRIHTGAGSADLRLGSLALTRLDLATGAGPVTVDLIGNWLSDLDAKIDQGLGEVTLRLPRNACVRVDAGSGLGKVHAQGLMKDGNGYFNDACSKSQVTLRIGISAGVGGIKLAMGE